ncbi:MAG: hypothetical protein IKK80_07110 [Treponema sp.]|nr:hypothetical protein [Treponema sp.]
MKKIILFLLHSFIFISLFCNELETASTQNSEEDVQIESIQVEIEQQEKLEHSEKESKKTIFGKKFAGPKNFKDFTSQLDFVLQFQTAIYLNTESTLVSAPSPILFPVTIGALWPNYTFLAIQPSLSFFMMNSLWHNNKALPAEIENRTATSYCLFFNIPAVFSIYLKNSRVQLSAGAGILLPITTISSGVKPSDSGTTGSAASDVSAIQKYYLSKGRFFYFTTEASWLFDITSKLKVGPVINLQIPVGSFINGEGFARFMGQAGIKISL